MDESIKQEDSASQTGQVMDIQTPKPVEPPVEAPTSEAPAESHAQDAPVAAHPNSENPMAINSQNHSKKSGAPVMAIVVAILIALGLAGGVVYMYLKNKNTTKPSASTTSVQPAAKPQASISDVDTTNQQIDTSLSKANDSKDFSSSDLSDSSLGL